MSKIKFDNKVSSEEIKLKIEMRFSEEKFKNILNEKLNIYENSKKYDEILKIFNYKELSDKICGKFGLTKGEYRRLIINLLKRSEDETTKNKIIDAIKPYIPVMP
ncbi:hypothetical protein PTI45_03239 [Paenibacillus nuruki]|uniref:Uncharacterized protein n=1 Tax=Paenibacillus nuruki TaxID=1886670 RepID=A0A1E3L122_9BACL|nr:hypothetical protein PTI45_03239 [Paenibacillus nuruki]